MYNLRICESANLRICESANLWIREFANLRIRESAKVSATARLLEHQTWASDPYTSRRESLNLISPERPWKLLHLHPCSDEVVDVARTWQQSVGFGGGVPYIYICYPTPLTPHDLNNYIRVWHNSVHNRVGAHLPNLSNSIARNTCHPTVKHRFPCWTISKPKSHYVRSSFSSLLYWKNWLHGWKFRRKHFLRYHSSQPNRNNQPHKLSRKVKGSVSSWHWNRQADRKTSNLSLSLRP